MHMVYKIFFFLSSLFFVWQIGRWYGQTEVMNVTFYSHDVYTHILLRQCLSREAHE